MSFTFFFLFLLILIISLNLGFLFVSFHDFSFPRYSSSQPQVSSENSPKFLFLISFFFFPLLLIFTLSFNEDSLMLNSVENIPNISQWEILPSRLPSFHSFCFPDSLLIEFSLFFTPKDFFQSFHSFNFLPMISLFLLLLCPLSLVIIIIFLHHDQ